MSVPQALQASLAEKPQAKKNVTNFVPGDIEEYLSLFPHRWDFIWAEHPNPGDRPDWKTESRHPLSDRLIQQNGYLYGVRFGAETSYLVIDVDSASLYHPDCDPLAIGQILAALEAVGIVEHVAINSSSSGGIHLYLPFAEPQKTWTIAQAVQTLLENAGFKVMPGQLELFPNARTYSETLSLYNGHRLPLQAGSYLLNADYQPVHTTQGAFVQRWQWAQQRNDVNAATVDRILKQAQRKRRRISGKADKFLNDLNAEIEPGWTGTGQTNYIAGRIAMRERVFGHVRYGGEPLQGEALADSIAAVAQSLPGYHEYCQHQQEIFTLARMWARSAEQAYYPYGSKKRQQASTEASIIGEPAPPKRNWNNEQSESARQRILEALQDLLEAEGLPISINNRRAALEQRGINPGTLYRHLDLWHPNYLSKSPEALQEARVTPVVCDRNDTKSPEALQEARVTPVESNKFVRSSAAPQQPDVSSESGGYGGFSTEQAGADVNQDALEGSAASVTDSIGDWTREKPAQNLIHDQQRQRQIEQWLSSGDPILVAEASRLAAVSLPRGVSGDRAVLDVPLTLLDLAPPASDRSSPAESSHQVGEDQSSSPAPEDLSDILAEISIHMRRSQWSPPQARQFIADHFSGKSRWQLDDGELLSLLGLLRHLE